MFSGPTCTIPVRNDLTTLDLTVQQIEHLNRSYDTDVPLVLMNSFLTEEDTARLVRKYSSLRVTIHTFTQSRYPRCLRRILNVAQMYLKCTSDVAQMYLIYT